jgi:hypothetical protein
MNHIDTKHGIGLSDWPIRQAGVDIEGGPDIGDAARCDPGIDAQAGLGAWIAGLNHMLGEPFAKADAMLPGAAGNFEQKPLRRQNALQNIGDEIAIAQGRRGVETKIFNHGLI